MTAANDRGCPGRVLLHSGGPLGPEGRRALADFFAASGPIGFVTAANLHDEAAYFERARGMLAPAPPDGAGLELVHVRWDDRPAETLAEVSAVFMGGGNTYALLWRLRQSGLLSAIRERVLAGMPYAGASAGSNVAGPTILTTNDWNVVGLDRFDALRLVGFNINPHYKELDPAMAPGSETRDDRIREYHVVNANPVLGLEEGAMVRVEGGAVTALGTARVKLFRRGVDPVWYTAGGRLPVD
jgi:dipeptidase E